MTKEESFKILKLKPGAGEKEIRSQFKRLALKVHPDINPDPKAHEEFILLTQAMEVAIGSDIQIQNSKSKKSANRSTVSEDELRSRMEEAKKRFDQRQKQYQSENQKYYESLTTGRKWLIFRLITIIGLIFSCCLILDEILPHHKEQDHLSAFGIYKHRGIENDEICLVEFNKLGKYYAKIELGKWLYSYPEATIETTWILHTPLKFELSDDFTTFETPFDFHIGTIRWYLAVLLLFPLIPYARRRMNLGFIFAFQFSFWGIGLLEIYLLITEHRLQHILTFGLI